MPIRFRSYNPSPLFGADYENLRTFLLALDSSNYHFGRWDWMITHRHLDAAGLSCIGLWEADGAVVAIATYDCTLGQAYLMTLPGYESLWQTMLAYAQKALAKDGQLAVLIQDGDLEKQTIAQQQGFLATQDKECDAVYLLTQGIPAVAVPDGFHITSMQETYDLYQYGQVLWKGFDHETNGEGPFVWNPSIERECNRPHVTLDLKIAVTAPNGDFVSYCGMWQDHQSQSALVEPVATDPAYRKLGLGRAAVTEGLRRCAALGAVRAYVGSAQPFYYRIGFRPYTTSSWWKQKS